MPRRTSLKDAKHIESAYDLYEVLNGKRGRWRASAFKTRSIKRRYIRRMTKEVARLPQNDTYLLDD